MKNLIICIDGTTNATEVAPGEPTPTNVLLFARALAMRDAGNAPQIVNYIRGVGTDESAGRVGRTTASARGTGLSQIVQNAYEFLTNNYESDDYVYILGFSRGAAAARSLSGLTELFGVLPKSLMNMFPVAWDYYNTPVNKRSQEYLENEDHRLSRIAQQGEALRSREGVRDGQRADRRSARTVPSRIYVSASPGRRSVASGRRRRSVRAHAAALRGRLGHGLPCRLRGIPREPAGVERGQRLPGACDSRTAG